MPFRKLLRGYKAVNLLISFLFLYSSSVVSAGDLPEGKVVSLSHNPASSDLIVAYPQALYQFDTQTQQRVSVALPAVVERITAVVAQAGNPGVIYLAAPGAGVLRSTDSGKNWEPRNEGLPGKAVTGLIGHAKQSGTLYAVIPEAGIFRSENAGGEWQLMDGGPENMTDIMVHSDMPGSMQTGWVFAATQVGVSRSMDCFCLWREAGALVGEITGLTYNPKQPAHIYAATVEGVFRSQDGGENWALVEGSPPGVTALFVNISGQLYAGTRSGLLFKKADQTKRWQQLDGF